MSDRQRTRNERDEQLKQKAAKRVLDFRALLEIEAGRNVLWWLLEETNTFHEDFTPNSMTLSRMSGRRSVGLQVLGEMLEADELALSRLMVERKRRRENERRTRNESD